MSRIAPLVAALGLLIGLAGSPAAEAHTTVVIRTTSAVQPPPHVDARGHAPGRDYVWVDGPWNRERWGWSWTPGHWRRVETRSVWVEGHWVGHGRNANWVPGHWDRF